jgi:hypothetical protein
VPKPSPAKRCGEGEEPALLPNGAQRRWWVSEASLLWLPVDDTRAAHPGEGPVGDVGVDSDAPRPSPLNTRYLTSAAQPECLKMSQPRNCGHLPRRIGSILTLFREDFSSKQASMKFRRRDRGCGRSTRHGRCSMSNATTAGGACHTTAGMVMRGSLLAVRVSVRLEPWFPRMGRIVAQGSSSLSNQLHLWEPRILYPSSHSWQPQLSLQKR